MTYITDLFSESDLAAALESKHVRVRRHPTLPLLTYGYTEKAVWEKVWTPVTRNCRGLIVDLDSKIVGRAFSKFWNYGEGWEQNQPPPEFDLDSPIQAVEKVDGSLGISYPTPTGYAIATRGSFESDQAIFATGVLLNVYPNFSPEEGYTYLWEIVYPENRIVVHYDGVSDLILLGRISIATGKYFGPDVECNWTGPRAKVYDFTTLREALESEQVPNFEGFVIRFLADDLLVKFKFEAYRLAHGILTNATPLSIWQMLASGKTLEEICEAIPDEFHDFVRGFTQPLLESVDIMKRECHDCFITICSSVDAGNRREFAQLAVKTSHAPAMFTLLDGKDISEYLWKRVRPTANGIPRPE